MYFVFQKKRKKKGGSLFSYPAKVDIPIYPFVYVCEKIMYIL